MLYVTVTTQPTHTQPNIKTKYTKSECVWIYVCQWWSDKHCVGWLRIHMVNRKHNGSARNSRQLRDALHRTGCLSEVSLQSVDYTSERIWLGLVRVGRQFRTIIFQLTQSIVALPIDRTIAETPYILRGPITTWVFRTFIFDCFCVLTCAFIYLFDVFFGSVTRWL